MRAFLGLAAVLPLVGGCWLSHEPGGAREPVRTCGDAVGAPDGAPCEGAFRCEGPGACCATALSCTGGRILRERRCGPRCFRECDAALAEAHDGDTCEGSFFCARLSPDRCCTHSVECIGGFVLVDDVCGTTCEGDPWCTGYVPPGPGETACWSGDDCAGSPGTSCVGPGDFIGCGICTDPPRTCATDADCGPGDLCVERPVACSCDGGGSTACEPDCRATAACPDDLECDASGACRPPSCARGRDCGHDRECVPGAAGADEHGCVRRACATDDDCSCGACVNDRCYDGPGICLGAVP
jgi:hypothetical protein